MQWLFYSFKFRYFVKVLNNKMNHSVEHNGFLIIHFLPAEGQYNPSVPLKYSFILNNVT